MNWLLKKICIFYVILISSVELVKKICGILDYYIIFKCINEKIVIYILGFNVCYLFYMESFLWYKMYRENIIMYY